MFLRRFTSTSPFRRLPLTIRQLLANEDTNDATTAVTITGFVKSIRRQKRVAFAAINDGSSTDGLQAVLDPEIAKGLTNGCSVRLIGKLVDSQGKGQDKELVVEECHVVGTCDPETYPIQKQSLSAEYLRENLHLRARTDAIASLLRVRDGSLKALNDYFHSEGFVYVNTPILTGNDCEGAGEAFQIAPASHRTESSSQESEFFDRPAYLTVSSQLHLEALAQALSRVYTISPCFRAERSQTNRHLSEFWMLEAEWGFTRDVNEVCDVVEGSIKSVLDRHTKNKDMELLWKEGDERKRACVERAMTRSWTRITYTDAIKELVKDKDKFEFGPRWGKGLQSEHEKWLADKIIKGPVFVTDYPTTLKPFYMRINEDPETVACFDLLMPHLGELAGGSLREERAALLERALGVHGLDKTDYQWYKDLRTFGGAPHGGFGLGLERLISWMTGVENVRECIPIPRWAGRLLL